jgi:prephenate dehydrogenase
LEKDVPMPARSTNVETDSIQSLSVGIVGLGLMGGSLALGLAGLCRRRIGLDSDPEAERAAREMGAVDELASHFPDLVAKSDFLVLATPIRTILGLLKELGEIRITDGRIRIVMDIGSTKTDILRSMDRLGEGFDPVGGHPICGREVHGIRCAEPKLYRDAPFVLAPLDRTSPRALRLARELVGRLGARPLEFRPEEHDQLVAGTSHLPHLAAVALAQTAGRLPSADALVGPGFRDTTRLAATNTEMLTDILMTNRENVLQALEEYIARLEALAVCVHEGDEARLKVLLAEGRRARQELLAGRSGNCGS